MTEPRMPTTLPSPADRGEYQFVAVDAGGTLWRWIDEEMVWACMTGEPDAGNPEIGGCDVLH